MNVSIIGGSGYAGGELVRLLLDHPEVTIQQVTSERNAGKFVRSVHPNLRKRSDLKFSTLADLQPADVIFSALPHGVAMGQMAELRQKAPIIIDLSADFRLRDAADYPKWYGHEHSDPRAPGIIRLRHSGAASPGAARRRSDLQRRVHGGDVHPRSLPPLPGEGRRPLPARGGRGQDRIVRLGRRARTRARITPSGAAPCAPSSRPAIATRPRSSRS